MTRLRSMLKTTSALGCVLGHGLRGVLVPRDARRTLPIVAIPRAIPAARHRDHHRHSEAARILRRDDARRRLGGSPVGPAGILSWRWIVRSTTLSMVASSSPQAQKPAMPRCFSHCPVRRSCRKAKAKDLTEAARRNIGEGWRAAFNTPPGCRSRRANPGAAGAGKLKRFPSARSWRPTANSGTALNLTIVATRRTYGRTPQLMTNPLRRFVPSGSPPYFTQQNINVVMEIRRDQCRVAASTRAIVSRHHTERCPRCLRALDHAQDRPSISKKVSFGRTIVSTAQVAR